MANETENPYDFFKLPNHIFAAPERFLPSATLLENMSHAVQIIGQAQVDYGHALLRANAAMFDAWLPRRARRDSEGPAQAARESEFARM